MSDQINKFPEAASEFAAGIKALNRNPTTSSGSGYYVLDSLSLDFKIQGFINDENRDVSGLTLPGTKFIINTSGDLHTSITDYYVQSTENQVGFDILGLGDVIVWNPSFIRSTSPTLQLGAWELWYDASNNGISGPSGGAFGYVVEEQQFYGYFGSELGWDTVGVGNTGNTGNTGADAIVGAAYTNQSQSADVDVEGEIFVSNNTNHFIKIHAENNSTPNNSDLRDLFFPNGVNSEFDNTNPKVLLSLYNDTNKQTFTIKVSLNASAVGSGSDNDIITIDFSDGDSFSSYEVISSTSGSFGAGWVGDNVWEGNDEIYVLSISDGVAGVDGLVGLTGATGQGITFSSTQGDPGELFLQYIDANGQNLGNPFPTGIVDGSTGDPGEVGFLLAATGASLGDSTGHWGNNDIGNTGDVQAGEIFYTNVNGEKIVAIAYTAKESSSSPPFVFGFTAGDAASGTEYQNKKGTLYFYEEIGQSLILKSFLKYTQARCEFGDGNNPVVLLKGITDSPISGIDDVERLGITLGANGAATDIYTLISPDGLKGTGITFGAIIDNTLFLDYIDENGNTFGRFESVEGVSGNPGSMNPFNVPFEIGTVTGSNPNSGVLNISEVNNVLTTLTVNGTADNGDDVFTYLQYPISTNNQNRSGFLTVFSTSSVEDFGVFRFTTGSSSVSNNTVTYGSVEKPLLHVGGNITEIIGTPPTGFATGTDVLFAINTDGPKGAGGSAGTGFTYGNEYFVSSILGKPEARTDGSTLEIGDKWFCTDVGLEFTYLGVSGDGLVNTEAGPGTGPTADGNYPVVWVQTNNARQGQQGPRGDRGLAGQQGNNGATGINDFGIWTAGTSYTERSGVYVTRAACIGAAGGNADTIANINNNWDSLTTDTAGATNGFFVIKTNIVPSSTNQIPGNFQQNVGWKSTQSKWSPVVVNAEGPEGPEGGVGNTGDSVKGFVGIEDENNIYLDALIQDSIGGAEQSFRILDADGSNVNFRGPTGPPGALEGSQGELIYISTDGSGVTGQGTLSAVRIEVGATDRLVLNNYRENTSRSGTLALINNVLNVNCNQPAVHYEITSNQTINEINFENMEEIGDGATVYIRSKIGGAITWNVGDDDYSRDGNQIASVFVSSQGFPTPGEIEFPSNVNEDFIGAFTFKYISDNDSGVLAVNFVPFTLNTNS